MIRLPHIFFFFFFNDTATTEIYTLSLHDALPIFWMYFRMQDLSRHGNWSTDVVLQQRHINLVDRDQVFKFCIRCRSEEHTSELQSPCNLVCRLLLEKKKTICLHPYVSRLVD